MRQTGTEFNAKTQNGISVAPREIHALSVKSTQVLSSRKLAAPLFQAFRHGTSCAAF
jgi:hypothetical protein